MKTIFVYGSLKSGFHNNHYLAGQMCLGEARTAEQFWLWDCGSFPAMTRPPEGKRGVHVFGEVWRVDEECKARIDRLEAGYKERPIMLVGPQFKCAAITAYLYERSTEGMKPFIGGKWDGGEYFKQRKQA